MNYRSHFQPLITKLQRRLDQAMLRGDWGVYLRLRHQMIDVKTHILEHEAQCGYECACEPDHAGRELLNAQ